MKIDINNQDYLVQQPVIAYCKDGLRNISKLHLVLRNKPFENGESITIDGIGIIKGKYEVKNGRLHLYVS